MVARSRRTLRIAGVRIGITHRGLARKVAWTFLPAIILCCPISSAIIDAGSGSAEGLRDAANVLGAATLCTPWVLFVIWLILGATRASTAALQVDATGITFFDGDIRKFVDWPQVVGGLLVEDGASAIAELQLRNGDVYSIACSSERIASELLEVARLDPMSQCYRMGLGRASHQILLGCGTVVAIWSLLGFAVLPYMRLYHDALANPVALGAVPATVVLVCVVLKCFAVSVVVGADGIEICEGFGARFLPFGRIGSVGETGTTIVLTLNDGRAEELPANMDDPSRRPALVRRIRDSMAASAARASASVPSSFLARDRRSLPAWRVAATASLERSSAYRDAPLTVDDVCRVLRDPAAKLEHRLGAGLALIARGCPGAREQIALSGEASANATVRQTMNRLATGRLTERDVERAFERSG